MGPVSPAGWSAGEFFSPGLWREPSPAPELSGPVPAAQVAWLQERASQLVSIPVPVPELVRDLRRVFAARLVRGSSEPESLWVPPWLESLRRPGRLSQVPLGRE